MGGSNIAGLRRPRLKSTLDCFESSEGALYILRPGADEDLVIREPSGPERGLLEALERAAPVAELEARFGGAPALEEALYQLNELGLIEDVGDDVLLDADDRARYDRQLAYFSEIGAPGTSRAGCQRSLAASRVTIIGVGGLGSWAALGLACTGVGRLDLIDGDRVELSNLNRQVLYGARDIDQPKAAAAARAIQQFNPAVEVHPIARRLESTSEVRELIAGSDAVVGTADWPPFAIGQWINSACFAAGIPWIAASQFPPKVRVGPTYLPGESGCLHCQESVWRAEHPLLDEIAAQGCLQPRLSATFGPACGIVGSLIANEIVHLITGLAPPATAGTALLLDLRTAEITREPVPRIGGCPVCAAT